MALASISPNEFAVQVHDLWDTRWLLLTCGDFSKNHYNTMTVSWGSLGTLWNKPVAQVFVRPTRNTYRFMELYPTFTLCAFPAQYRGALNILGTKSGRDTDKIAEAGLTPVPASCVTAPAFLEAELIIECQKLYWHDFQPPHFIDPGIAKHYPLKDYHRAYYGEILAICGEEKYRG